MQFFRNFSESILLATAALKVLLVILAMNWGMEILAAKIEWLKTANSKLRTLIFCFDFSTYFWMDSRDAQGIFIWAGTRFGNALW